MVHAATLPTSAAAGPVDLTATKPQPQPQRNMQEVLAAINMTEEEHKRVMAVNANWPHPAHLDGWVLIHNAIRWDMDQIGAALRSLASQLAAGQGLEEWQVHALAAYYRRFYTVVHHHHDNEELIFFPFMSSRVKLPAKMSKDHEHLIAAMDKCSKLATSFVRGQPVAQQAAAMQELQRTFDAFAVDMREHLQEEEDVGLPLLRKHFTAAEAAVPEAQIKKGLTPADFAYVLRPIPSVEQRRSLMSAFGIPWLVQRLILEPAMHKDANHSVLLVRSLQAGKRLKPQKSAAQRAMSYFKKARKHMDTIQALAGSQE